MEAGPLGSNMLSAITDYSKGNKKNNMEFSISNAYKDLMYFKEELVKENNPLIDIVISTYKKAIKNGYGNKSVAEIYKFI